MNEIGTKIPEAGRGALRCAKCREWMERRLRGKIMPEQWLIIERLENWDVDKAANFSMFGLSARYKAAAQRIKKGDFIFCYVSSRISSFSDIRIVTEDGSKPIRRMNDYDTAFDFYISTAPLLVLPRRRWLPLNKLRDKLDLTKNRPEWRQLFRTSVRPLTEHDAGVIKNGLERLAGVPSNTSS